MNLRNILAAAALAFAFSGNAVALPVIGGSIDITGSFTTNTGDLSTATAFDSFSYTQVQGGTGTGVFAGLWSGNSTATMDAFGFAPLSNADPIWTVVTGSNTFTFDLTNVTIESQGVDTDGNAYLYLSGGGVLHGVDDANVKSHEDTNGGWTFSSTRTNETDENIIFSFQSNTVPAPASIALLGLGLLAFGVTRTARKV